MNKFTDLLASAMIAFLAVLFVYQCGTVNGEKKVKSQAIENGNAFYAPETNCFTWKNAKGFCGDVETE